MKFINERVADKVELFYKDGKVVATNFLNPSEISQVLSEVRFVEHVFWGGFDGAERKIILIGIEDSGCVNTLASEFISVLRVSLVNSDSVLLHRSVLLQRCVLRSCSV